MAPPRHGEEDRPTGGGGGQEPNSPPRPSLAGATASSASREGSSRVPLAAIAGAHGVRGELRLKLFTDSADKLARHPAVFIAGTERRLLELREGGKAAIARIEGIDDRSAAEALRGALVEVDRDALPPLDEGEYYHADLIGLACVDRDGEPVGEVVAVENFGAGDLLEIALSDGRKSLIPFRDGIADLQDGRIVLDPEFLA